MKDVILKERNRLPADDTYHYYNVPGHQIGMGVFETYDKKSDRTDYEYRYTIDGTETDIGDILILLESLD